MYSLELFFLNASAYKKKKTFQNIEVKIISQSNMHNIEYYQQKLTKFGHSHHLFHYIIKGIGSSGNVTLKLFQCSTGEIATILISMQHSYVL